MKKFIIIVFAITLNYNTYSQTPVSQLTGEDIEETISSVKKILNENYVFPEIAEKIIFLLETNQEKNKYDAIKDPSIFAEILTRDIQSFNSDRHLRVLFEPERIAKQKITISAEDNDKSEQEYMLHLKRNNYYFNEVKILEGNIGYLDLRKFRDPKYAGKTAISAMNFLGNSDAIIIDLRNNGGGTPKMVQFISTYFFNNEVVHLNSVYKRKEDILKQFWTLPYVPGKRMANIPLYILTSTRTFSAAEEFSYNLQSLKRATIVGEITGGGAHPGGRITANERYNVWTPTARSINPITKTNWENIGVIPDIKTKEEDALKTAHLRALDSLKNNNTNAINYYDDIIITLQN